MAFIDHALIPDLKSPVLISAFASDQKGGTTATAALNYALERWDARPVSAFDSEGFYNYARMRPWIRREGDATVIDWPQNTVYRVDGPEHSYLFLIGVEPTMNWREFVTGVGEFAMRMGVETALNLKSVPAMVPHTFDSPVRAIYSSPELKEEYGFQELEDQEGPADIGRVLNLHLASQGCRTVDLYAMEPFYAAAIPDAGASLSLLNALRSGFDLAVDTEPLKRAAETQRQAIDTAVSSSEQLRETVARLERRVGTNLGLSSGERLMLAERDDPADDLNAISVLNEAESILRNLKPED
jgi:hypothetical protein